MPSKPKKKPKKVKSYTEDDLKEAVQHIQCGFLSQRKASLMFGIPKTTLQNALSGTNTFQTGRAPSLPKEKEEEIVNFILFAASSGYPLIQDQILDEVHKMVEKLDPKPFNGERPSRGWLMRFEDRWSHRISCRTPARLSVGHAMLTKEQIRNWFYNGRVHFTAIPGALAALNDANRVFNADESGFPLDQSNGVMKKVFAQRGSKHVRIRSCGAKEQITVLACGNAAGKFLEPFLIFPGE